MASRPGPTKKSGRASSGKAGDKDSIAKLKERIAALENELRSCREKAGTIDSVDCKQAEDALRAGEERYRSLIESTGDWVWEVDQDFVLTYDSPRGREILGYRPDEVIGRVPFSFMPEDELERIKLIAWPAIARHEPIQRIENRLIKKDGSIVTIETSGIPLFDESGRYRGYRGVNHDITDRKRAEEALKLTQFALDNFGESSIWVAKDGRIVYGNQAACRSLGYSREELLSMHIWDIDPNYPREMIWELWSVRKRDRYTKFESVHIARDGRAFPVEVTSSYIQYGDKEYVITFDRDITERKRAEGALRDSEEKYRALFESSFDAVIIALPDGRIESANAEACRIFGKTEEEIIREGRDGIADKTDTRWQAFVEERERTGVSRGDLIYRRKDGTIFPGEASSALFTDSTGHTKVAIIIRDITERKRAEAELERVNRALRAISKCKEAVIHAKGESALIYDVCRIIVDVGGYRMAWVGYAENDNHKTVRPMAYHGFEDGYMATVNVTWEDTERGRGPTGTAVRTGKPCVIRYVVTDPNFLPWRDDAQKRGYNSVLGLPLVQDGHSLGALTIYSEKPDAFDEKEISLLRDLADNLAYGVISLRNQVKRIESEAALKAAKAQAELYLDLMGHDINNMHQVALGYLELAKNLPAGDSQTEFLDKSVEVLQRSTQLIANVRKLQQLHDGVFQIFRNTDVCSVLANIKSEYSAISSKTIILNVNGHEHCYVQANELLHDVFSNLVNNAIKHTGDGSEINVDLNIVDKNGKRYCQVAVEDNGPGISDNIKERIFNRMHKGSARGMGLGLYLVRTLVDSYGGRVWVEDRVLGDHTKGARFVVLLPAIEK